MKQSDYEKLSTPPRQKTSVAISGLDRSTPDDIVKDGACEELHNVRYKDNAWRPVSNFALESTFPDVIFLGTDTFGQEKKIRIKRIITPFAPVGKKAYVCFIEHISPIVIDSLRLGYGVVDFDKNTLTTINIQSEIDESKVYCFGNIVYLDDKAYIYSAGAFAPFDVSDFQTLNTISYPNATPLEPDYFMVDETFVVTNGQFAAIIEANNWVSNKERITGENLLTYLVNNGNIPTSAKITLAWKFADRDNNDNAEDSILPDSYNNQTSGEHAFFTAFRMEDGTILNPSALGLGLTQNYFPFEIIGEEISVAYINLSASDTTHGRENIIYAYYSTTATEYKEKTYTSPAYFSNGKLNISLPSQVLPQPIKSVAVFSTRIYPSLKKDLSAITSTPQPLSIIFNDIKLPEELFYLLKEIPLTDFKNGAYELQLTATSLTDIVSNVLYEPIIVNNLSAAGTFDFNQRLHLYDIKQQIDLGQYLSSAISGGAGDKWSTGVRLLVNGMEFLRWGQGVNGTSFAEPFNRVLSFHDARLSDFLLHKENEEASYRFASKQALGNNISYYIAPSTATEKYPSLSLTSESTSQVTPSTPNEIIHETNRIQVSAPNNPISLPFSLSYKLGSNTNRIIALQVATMQIAEEKIGDLPLVAFTDEGVYALRAGSETLYARSEFINFDKIVNPNTVAIDGGIVYVTDRGVHLLNGTISTVISSPIHDGFGKLPALFNSCKICALTQTRELVFFTESDSTSLAYVYNLDAGYWATRDISGYLLENKKLVTHPIANFHVFNTYHEDESKALPMTITTRPIKLGNIEFKRLETIAPRMSSGDKDFASHIHLTGSVDGTNYMTLREHDLDIEAHKVNPFTLRRTPFSAKYFKYHMFMEPKQGETFNPSITHIDFEWYIKFRRRMR